MMSPFRSDRLAAGLVLIGLTAGACAAPLAPSASPAANAVVSPAATGPAPTASTPREPGSFQVLLTDEDGQPVTLDIEDASGRLVEAVQGEHFEASWIENASRDVSVANDPGDPTVLRVEWFVPAGCQEQHSISIEPGARRITIQASFEADGDSIGGNCGVTLHFSEPVEAAGVEAILANTPPPPTVRSIGRDQTARVVATDGLRVRSRPGTGADSERLVPLLPESARVFIVDGPVDADGYAWYLAAPYESESKYPFGWIAVASREGEPWVEPLDVQCPESPLNVGELASGFMGLECFGADEIVVSGALECSTADVDRVIGGPTWLSSIRHCTLGSDRDGPTIEVHGDAVLGLVDDNGGNRVAGQYRITGHFADPASSSCVGHSELGVTNVEAVLLCRQSFVAVEAIADQ